MAVYDFEPNLRDINRKIVEDFLKTNKEYQSLKKIHINLWKFLARENGPISWSLNEDDEIDQYSLYLAADQLLNHLEECLIAYDLYLNPIKKSRFY